jgi:hypothetical protein
MNKNRFYLLPRILAILFIIFISLFALDVFGQPQWFLALLTHLIPSYILIILTIIAWKNEKIGGILFLITAVLTAILLRSTVPIVLIPTLVIGVLFLVAKTSRRDNL